MRELSPGDLIAGKFRLECVVGRGGMGSVWAARNEQLGMLVALKFIESGGGADLTDARARFEREARAAAQIRSPHVAQIFEHGVDGDRPFIAMELLEGEDLGQRLRREGRIAVPAAARILTQAAKALRRAHETGIIHRDLKPGNVFLARFDDDEMVKILDFGVAKVIAAGAIEGSDATQTGMVFGSPSYMSPEQARGVRALDHRTDLWSLAVIAFRAVTGVKPFDAATIGDLVVKLCIDPLPVATSIAPDLPPAIDRFFERAFARDPNARFASALELAAAFEQIAAGSPSQRPPMIAGPPSSSGPYVIPAPPAFSAPVMPGAGSGSHVAFAPGTLTPPPGSAPNEPVDIPRSPESDDDGRTMALPSPSEAAPPVMPFAPPAPPVIPIASGGDAARPVAKPASSSPMIAIFAAIGAASLGLIAIAVLLVSRGHHAEPVAPAVAVITASAIATAPAPTATAEPASPPPDPAPSASASASAAASADPPASSASAEPTAAPTVRPHLPKGRKRRPNFGY